jgi:DNA-binding Xre family transcriptional regulator
MGLTKRQMMFVPKMYPNPTFVLFFEKGDTGLSWTIRDYSEKGSPKTYGRRDFGWTADQVRQEAKYSFDAPAVDTNEIDYWHERTLEYNKQYLVNLTKSHDTTIAAGVIPQATAPDNADGKEDKIGQYLRVSKRDHNQEDLSRRAKVSASTISRIRQGHEARKSIRVAVANVISEEIPCSADDLLPLD